MLKTFYLTTIIIFVIQYCILKTVNGMNLWMKQKQFNDSFIDIVTNLFLVALTIAEGLLITLWIVGGRYYV